MSRDHLSIMLLDKRQIKAVIDAVKHYQTFNVSINSDRYIEFEVIIERLQNMGNILKE